MWQIESLPSFAANPHAFLSYQLTNNRTDRPTDLFVTLDKLALASRHYRLEILPGQFTTSDQVANVLQIGWQERMTVHYRVLPLEDESRTCLLSECPFLEDGDVSIAECMKSDGMDFLCLVWAAETFEVSNRCGALLFVSFGPPCRETYSVHSFTFRLECMEGSSK